MRIVKEQRICDRCHKHFEEDEIRHHVSDHTHFYELCELCNDDFKVYKEKTEKLYDEIEELTKKYQFNKYLPELPEGVEIW